MKALTAGHVRRLIPRRPLTAHKGSNGHVLIVAGSRGMAGAAVLSALGALKTGAGLVTVAATRDTLQPLMRRLPEAMTLPGQSLPDIRGYVRRRTITSLASGPGLGVGKSQKKLILGLIRLHIPLVLDADGLNNIRPRDIKGRPMIITPHAGELARLLGVSRDKIEKKRQAIAADTAKRLGVVCVLKGHRTVISDGRRTVLNPTGNPAMATGGMGDVLTGVIAALLAQGLSLFDAACAGVYLHGLAGDMAAVGDRGLLASELAEKIPHALKKVVR